MNKQILVVDDEPEIRSLLKEILEEEGFIVELAENAEIANQKRQSQRADLTLLDVWLPDYDGFEATRRVDPRKRLWRSSYSNDRTRNTRDCSGGY